MIYEKRGIAAQMPQFLDKCFKKIILDLLDKKIQLRYFSPSQETILSLHYPESRS